MFQKLKVIEESPSFIVINKRAGLITERNPFEIITVESLVEEYLTTGKRTPYSLERNQVVASKNRKNFKAPTKPKNAAFVGVVHRLDRVTSGTMVFAKKKNSLKKLNDQLSSRKIKKTYLAILENEPPNKAGTLRHYLVKNQKAKRADIFKENKKGSVQCTLSYELLKSSANGHLVKIELQTGRFHQIRAQFGFIGCPIIGDEKYGATKKHLPLAICLHAWQLQFRDPISNEEVLCEAEVPRTRYWQDFSHIL
ncbi:RluA family pseudouridine synthase [Aureispira sp. CCB-QB1]|uniref:RluA family pseudouridine synthase n=1 Tax=Aureispira sp. CCB-QB1 TaxID=1313421 RepID=UPI0006988A60|nr:RNA pseudouridine synthase [Aureispira sp. CCB-QB1]